jgi:hypothetical protein
MEIRYTKSQKQTIDFYKEKTNRFNEILSIDQNKDGVIFIETKGCFYCIGKLGGVTLNKKY